MRGGGGDYMPDYTVVRHDTGWITRHHLDYPGEQT